MNNQDGKHKPISNPKVTLLYPPSQTWPGWMCKPNGSLAYPYLGGALIDAGIEVQVFDACVGNEKDDLQEAFYKSTELPSGMMRTGVSNERILEEVANSDVIGMTSIFTDQENMVLRTAKLIKDAYPEKLIVAGGVNARNRIDTYLAGGIDVICLSEGEKTIVSIVDEVRKGSWDFNSISSVAFKKNGEVVINKTRPDDIIWDLDQLPMPAWHLLPNETYWKIGRPHGGHLDEVKDLRYGAIMTSRGCIFSCWFCHISTEGAESVSGHIGKHRIKSDERVLAEIDQLKKMGVKQLFIEDDSLFGQKKRALRLLKKMRGAGLDTYLVNGVNMIHLFKGSEPDVEVIEELKGSGCKEIVLPFETGSKRIMEKYVSNKFQHDKYNVKELIRVLNENGLVTAGNYIIGWPDETVEELEQTIELARLHRSWNIHSVNFYNVIPTPGTPLFEFASTSGHLPDDWTPDRANWGKTSMINTCIPPAELEERRRAAWRGLNDPEYVAYKLGMNVK